MSKKKSTSRLKKKAGNDVFGIISRGKKMDVNFLLLVIIIVAIGLTMLYSASYPVALYEEGNPYFYISKQAVFAVIGFIGMLMVSKIDYRILKKYSYLLYGITIILLIMVLFTEPLNGARRWLKFGVSIQPSEIAKFAVILIFATYISKHFSKMKTFKYGILNFGLIVAPVCILMILEPHLSGTILILSITFIMMFVGGTRLFYFAVGGGLVAALVAAMVMFTNVVEYASTRIEVWLDPFSDALGSGFQTIQSLLAIGSGGLMGLGLGNSRQKYLYIPEPQNDFIFSIVCEELGLIGALIILGLFMALVYRAFVIGMRSQDKFGAMLCVGIAAQVGMQVLLNIAVVTNTIPNTGISLPFFSYGGSSLLMLLLEMGVVLSVSRQSNINKN